MHILLRGGLVPALVCMASAASFAQTSAPASSAELPPAATTPLLSAAQHTGGSYKGYLYQRYATDQRARAVVHLFGRKQTGGIIWLSSGAAAITFVSSQTGTKTTDSGTTTLTVTPLGYLVLVGLFGGVGTGKLARFSNAKLYQTLAEYEKSRTLPPYVSKKLAKRDNI